MYVAIGRWFDIPTRRSSGFVFLGELQALMVASRRGITKYEGIAGFMIASTARKLEGA
jgi:hypothetical protein